MKPNLEHNAQGLRHSQHNNVKATISSALQSAPSTQKLIESFQALITDGEDIMNSLVGVSTEGVSLARDRFSEKLTTAKQAYQEAESSLRSKVSDATQSADQYMSDNPWRAVAIAASAGAVIALLMQRASR